MYMKNVNSHLRRVIKEKGGSIALSRIMLKTIYMAAIHVAEKNCLQITSA